jgi:hypothetical protein
MSRQTDVLSVTAVDPVPVQLPAIDWASIGQIAPQPVTPQQRQSTDPLPRADIVIITWTNAEWSALDHVFANSGRRAVTKRAPGIRTGSSIRGTPAVSRPTRMGTRFGARSEL